MKKAILKDWRKEIVCVQLQSAYIPRAWAIPRVCWHGKKHIENIYKIIVNAKNHRKCKKSRLFVDKRNRWRAIIILLLRRNGENPFPLLLTISGCTFSAYLFFLLLILIHNKISPHVPLLHDPCQLSPRFSFTHSLSFARFSEVVAYILSSPHFSLIMSIWFFVIVFSHSWFLHSVQPHLQKLF